MTIRVVDNNQVVEIVGQANLVNFVANLVSERVTARVTKELKKRDWVVSVGDELQEPLTALFDFFSRVEELTKQQSDVIVGVGVFIAQLSKLSQVVVVMAVHLVNDVDEVDDSIKDQPGGGCFTNLVFDYKLAEDSLSEREEEVFVGV